MLPWRRSSAPRPPSWAPPRGSGPPRPGVRLLGRRGPVSVCWGGGGRCPSVGAAGPGVRLLGRRGPVSVCWGGGGRSRCSRCRSVALGVGAVLLLQQEHRAGTASIVRDTAGGERRGPQRGRSETSAASRSIQLSTTPSTSGMIAGGPASPAIHPTSPRTDQGADQQANVPPRREPAGSIMARMRSAHTSPASRLW